MKIFKKVEKYPNAEKAAKRLVENTKEIKTKTGQIESCKMANDIITEISSKKTYKNKSRIFKNL